MASSNGTEIGALGTKEAGETPLWTQYTFVSYLKLKSHNLLYFLPFFSFSWTKLGLNCH